MVSVARARSRTGLALVAVSLLAPLVAGAVARAGTMPSTLTSSVDSSGSGNAVTTVRTNALRSATPRSTGPRILLVGTGVQRDLFPDALRASIVAAAPADGTDRHGYGTLAASTVFQLVPNATVISKAVRAADSNWVLADLDSLRAVLRWAAANRSAFDVVLLAFPPQAALDPVTYIAGYGNYGRFGDGLAMIQQALLTTKPVTDGPAVGIPADPAVRAAMFARANDKQRDAIERYARHAVAWRGVLAAVDQLDAAGIPVVAPSGDFTRRSGSTVLPLVTQTIYGLSALPSVVTVGAAYTDGATTRLSPTSGRGPTLALGAKPDLVAPSDVMTMLPEEARLQWRDDSARAPLQMLDWAKPGVPPSPCPPVTGTYRCVLQGSSMVSAAIVSANLGALVAAGTPRTASERLAGDDEILRGIAWAQASSQRARSSEGNRDAYPWEQGAGVFTGLAAFDPAAVPIALSPADIGEARWGNATTAVVPLWGGGAAVRDATASVTSFVGPDPLGRAVTRAWPDGGRIAATADGSRVVLTAIDARAQGGIYAGTLTLRAPTGASAIPVSLTQTLPIDVHVDYAYNELLGGGREGERVEDAGVVLFAGLPQNIGLVGEAFKNFGSSAYKHFGGDPTNSIFIRAARTKSAFTDATLPAREHGRARIPDVPPGFYRFHVLTDHAVEAVQARGRVESIGIQLGSGGTDGLNTGAEILVSSCAGSVQGPLPCAVNDGDVDPQSGLCVVRDDRAQVAFHVYCGEIAWAVPSAFVSRAVHLIEYDVDPTRSEWRTCGVDVPTDGKQIDLATIVDRAGSCAETTAPTTWSYAAGANECLAPAERSRFPSGHPDDVTASYHGAGSISVPGRNLPVGVLTYRFALPELNTYTTAGLSVSYVAENAIVALRMRAGNDSTGDASSGLLAIDGPSVQVKPAVPNTGARGTSYVEWATMSANARVGTLSVIVIPTAWARSDLDATKPIARVQLCDAALRVSTFAKAGWGAPSRSGLHTLVARDRGLLGQIDPGVARVRAAFRDGRFTDAGVEQEDLRFAIHIPKNTTTDPRAPHHVRSPHGGPASFAGARGETNGAAALPDGWQAYDPRYGTTSLACAPNAADPVAASVCKAWNAARAADATLAELGPDLSVNGRFAGILALDRAAVARAAGGVAFAMSTVDDAGAFDASDRWARDASGYARRFPIPNFFDEAGAPAPSIVNAVLSVAKPNGLPVLTVRTIEPAAGGPVVTASLG